MYVFINNTLSARSILQQNKTLHKCWSAINSKIEDKIVYEKLSGSLVGKHSGL